MSSNVDMNDLIWDEDFIYHKLQKGKGKCDALVRQMDVCLRPKAKSARTAFGGRDVASSVEGSREISVNVCHDIWFHIALQIEPEDVQRFALICKHTSRLVNTRSFWWSLYQRYCERSLGWNLKLPDYLQRKEILSSSYCDPKAFRSLVIESLFRCHQRLKLRLEVGYSLDWLLQRICVSSWQKQHQCLWIMCYKFWNQQKQDIAHQMKMDHKVMNDWEQLADNADNIFISSSNPYEGVVLLIIVCSQFVPTPLELSNGHQESRYRLISTRELLCTDMRAKNLELDFAENTNNSSSLTVKYSRIKNYKVLPWWHPDFQRFIK